MASLAFLFSFNGTAGRGAAFAVWLAGVISFVVMGVLAQLAPMQQNLFFPIAALCTVAGLTTSARRLHDAGHSGRWAVLTLLPLAGLLAGLIIAFLPHRRARLWANNGARLAGYVLIAAILAIGVWRVFWTPYLMLDESMKPTLLAGDYALMRVQAGADVVRGDVAVLRGPANGEITVKRVIALGGDRVALKDGVVWLNGAPLPQLLQGEFSEIMQPLGPSGLRPRCANGVVGDGAVCRSPVLREVLPDGRSYLVADIAANSAADGFAEILVPKGDLFVLGDNRDISLDSRFDTAVGGLGLVPQAKVFGVMRRVPLSAKGPALWMFWTWRSDRFWTRVD